MNWRGRGCNSENLAVFRRFSHGLLSPTLAPAAPAPTLAALSRINDAKVGFRKTTLK